MSSTDRERHVAAEQEGSRGVLVRQVGLLPALTGRGEGNCGWARRCVGRRNAQAGMGEPQLRDGQGQTCRGMKAWLSHWALLYGNGESLKKNPSRRLSWSRCLRLTYASVTVVLNHGAGTHQLWKWSLVRCIKSNIMDGPRDYHIKWRTSDGERQISCDITYMWHLKKWCKWTYLHNRNRLTDIENKLTVTEGDGKVVGGDKLGVWD